MSLSAKNGNGEIVYAPNITNKEKVYYCIGCGTPMVFVDGRIIIKHFRHTPHNSCDFTTEPESDWHMIMKMWVYEHLKEHADKVYYPDSVMVGKSKPDVYFELYGRKCAVECQASPISLSEVIKRTQKYSDEGVYVWWVWGIYGPFLYDLEDKLKSYNGYHAPAILRFSHALYFGKVWILKARDSEEDWNTSNFKELLLYSFRWDYRYSRKCKKQIEWVDYFKYIEKIKLSVNKDRGQKYLKGFVEVDEIGDLRIFYPCRHDE